MTVAIRQMVITIGAPDTINGSEGRRELASFYGALLGMQVVSEEWLRIAKDETSALQLALDTDGWSDQRPPRWPDPEFPKQMHLDIAVPDMAAASELVTKMGATELFDGGHWRVYADPAGHPFCIFPEEGAGDGSGPGVISRLVIDCFSPRSLAAFYEGLLHVDQRSADSPLEVVLALHDDRYPDVAFQHAEFVAPRWPDPAYPAQMHLDLRFDDGKEAAIRRAERLGAIRLPDVADTAIYADPAGHPFCL